MMKTLTLGGPTANSPCPAGQGNATVVIVNAPRTAPKAEAVAGVRAPARVRSASRVTPMPVTNGKAGSATRVRRKAQGLLPGTAHPRPDRAGWITMGVRIVAGTLGRTKVPPTWGLLGN